MAIVAFVRGVGCRRRCPVIDEYKPACFAHLDPQTVISFETKFPKLYIVAFQSLSIHDPFDISIANERKVVEVLYRTKNEWRFGGYEDAHFVSTSTRLRSRPFSATVDDEEASVLPCPVKVRCTTNQLLHLLFCVKLIIADPGL